MMRRFRSSGIRANTGRGTFALERRGVQIKRQRRARHERYQHADVACQEDGAVQSQESMQIQSDAYLEHEQQKADLTEKIQRPYPAASELSPVFFSSRCFLRLPDC